ncbi:fatty acid desaturase [Paenibacillus gansuensis]|uniref:Fatty acid desaturase n=1 Tax=Paenibacillus gansuensis TaxID=306542 RepID=A0ABW5P8N0_9BACL
MSQSNQNPIVQLKKNMIPFEKTDTKASMKQIYNTLIPLFALWAAAYFSLSVSYWLTLPLAMAASGFVVRAFIMFHDCCHGSFLKSRRGMDILGTILGILTLVPYQQWKHSHSVHHATSSNLDKRGVGDLWMLTVEEYKKASFWTRVSYHAYRHPFVMFVLGPLFVFGVQYRFNRKDARRKEVINTYVTNAGIAGLYALLIWLIGWQAFVLVQAPVFFFSGLLGIWLFYVQHTFEDSYFENEEDWSYVKAAVEGSSYYQLPKVLQWITGNIGYHHVHHLSPKVPNYHLEKAHNATPPLQKATTITLRTSLKSLQFHLYDEARQTFISFKQMKRRMAGGSASEPVLKAAAVPSEMVKRSKTAG